MSTTTTIREIKEANKAAGQYFFSPGAMRFFNSRILPGVIGGQYFITSERFDMKRRRQAAKAEPRYDVLRWTFDGPRSHYTYLAQGIALADVLPYADRRPGVDSTRGMIERWAPHIEFRGAVLNGEPFITAVLAGADLSAVSCRGCSTCSTVEK